MRNGAQGVPARLIAGTSGKSAKPLSKRKIREHVAELNRAAGTPRGRQRLRREETGAALVLESVRGRTGRPRMLNVKELNAFVRRKREWADTSYHATYRDVKAIDAFGVGSAAACRGVRHVVLNVFDMGWSGFRVVLAFFRVGSLESAKKTAKKWLKPPQNVSILRSTSVWCTGCVRGKTRSKGFLTF